MSTLLPAFARPAPISASSHSGVSPPCRRRVLTLSALTVAGAGATTLSVNAPSARATTALAASTDLVLRSRPRAAAPVLRPLPRGTVVLATGATDANWVQVIHEGVTGWAYGPSLVEPGTVTTVRLMTTTNLVLRARARASAAILRTMPRGVVVEATGAVDANWVQVVHAGVTGWAYGPRLTEVAGLPQSRTDHRFSAHGMSGRYHVFADGLDYSQPVGITWFFDGDYFTLDQSMVENPWSARMQGIVRESVRRNQMVVTVVTPAAYERGYGYTWWRQREANGAWFRALAAHVHRSLPFTVLDRQWALGYSGGAEFISMILMARQQLSWWRGAGASIVGGGTRPERFDVSSPGFRRLRATWHVNANDVAGQTNPPTWSARDAARSSEQAYREQYHFLNTRIVEYPMGGHTQYDFAGILARDLNAAGFTPLR